MFRLGHRWEGAANERYEKTPAALNWATIKNSVEIPDVVKKELNNVLRKKRTDQLRREKPAYTTQKKNQSAKKAKQAQNRNKKRARSSEDSPPGPSPSASSNPSDEAPTNNISPMPIDQSEVNDGPSMEDLTGQFQALLAQMKLVKTQIEEKKEAEKSDECAGKKKKGSAEDEQQELHYMVGGLAGKVCMDPTMPVITHADLVSGLVSAPSDTDESAKSRDRIAYEIAQHGHATHWKPTTHVLKHKNRVGQSIKEHETINKLEGLFSGDISTWSYTAQRIMVACSLFGYGCLDEGTIMIMAGTVKSLFEELDIDISNEQIAKAFPSRATLASMEPKVAADCFLSVCQEMKDDKATHLGLTCDHGHRKDQDHFVKLISWAGMDEDGNWTVKFYCPDIVSAQALSDLSSCFDFTISDLSRLIGF